jgi:hypothetical protein
MADLAYLPLGARKERLEDIPSSYLKGMECVQVSVPSERGVTLSGILATTSGEFQLSDPETVFVYFQGIFIPSCYYMRLVILYNR